ncbi:MAG: 6-pyruvoyl-tetrahydropterin synthase-related protein, partial [Chloroflexota bacterium]
MRSVDHPIQKSPFRAIVDKRWLLGDKVLVVLALFVAPLLAALPVMHLEPLATHDGAFHLFRAVELEACLRDGILYPRWAPDLAQGLGYPIFNFYAPLANYVQVSLRWLLPTFLDAFRASTALGLVVAGAGAYVFTSDLLGRRAGLIAALAYVYSPYLFRDAYVRSDLPELLALAILPFLLWSFRRLACGPSLSKMVVAAVTYALLVVTHNLTAYFFTPLLLAYVAVWLVWIRGWRSAPYVVGGVLLGLALSSFYWLPAFWEKEWVQFDKLVRLEWHDFRVHFKGLEELLGWQVPSDIREQGAEPDYKLGMSQAILAVLGLASLFRRRVATAAKLQIALCAVATVLLLFMMGSSSEPVWEALPMGSFIQFPWRLLGPASLTLALLAGASTLLLPEANGGRWRLPARFAATALLAGIALFIVIPFLVLPSYIKEPGAQRVSANPSVAEILGYERWSGTLGTTVRGEYLPIWVEYLPKPPADNLEPCEECVRHERLDQGTLPPGVTAKLVEERTGYSAYQVTSEREFGVLFKVLYYPAWQGYVNGQAVRTEPFTDQGLGWVVFSVPPGGGLVELKYEDTPLARTGNAVSLAALGAVGALLVVGRRRGSFAPAPGAVAPQRWHGAWVVPLAMVAVLVLDSAYIAGHTTWFRTVSAPGTIPAAQKPAAIAFGDEVVCSGYSLSEEHVKPGDK